MRKRAAISILLAALMTGCGGSSDFGGADARPSTVGDLTIVTPQPGATFEGADSIPVELSLTGATILEEASTTLSPDTGHVHVILDDEVLSLLTGLEFDLADLAKEPITPGTHLLRVEFVAADHGAFSPREVEQLTFTVLVQ